MDLKEGRYVEFVGIIVGIIVGIRVGEHVGCNVGNSVGTEDIGDTEASLGAKDG